MTFYEFFFPWLLVYKSYLNVRYVVRQVQLQVIYTNSITTCTTSNSIVLK